MFSASICSPGPMAAQVRQRFSSIWQHAAPVRPDQREVRDYITALTDQWFGLTYVQIAVAVLVAIWASSTR